MESNPSSDDDEAYESGSRAANSQIGSNLDLRAHDTTDCVRVSCGDTGSECCGDEDETIPEFECIKTHESLRPAFVYMIMSPSREGYIGETTRAVSKRMEGHKNVKHKYATEANAKRTAMRGYTHIMLISPCAHGKHLQDNESVREGVSNERVRAVLGRGEYRRCDCYSIGARTI